MTNRPAFDLFVMSNLRATTTGVVGAVIWVSAGEFARPTSKDGPRIVVVPGDRIASQRLKDGVTVRLTEPPEVLGDLPRDIEEQAVRFVAKNRAVLLRYWSGALSTREMLDLIEKV